MGSAEVSRLAWSFKAPPRVTNTGGRLIGPTPPTGAPTLAAAYLAFPLVHRWAGPQVDDLRDPVAKAAEMLSIVFRAGLADPLVRGLIRSGESEPCLEHPGPRSGGPSPDVLPGRAARGGQCRCVPSVDVDLARHVGTRRDVEQLDPCLGHPCPQ